VQNRFGYAGYRYDHHLSGGAGAGRHLYHVRHRVYQAHIGRWMTRDPLGYVDGMGLYEYVRGMAVVATDPLGLFTSCAGLFCSLPGECVQPDLPPVPPAPPGTRPIIVPSPTGPYLPFSDEEFCANECAKPENKWLYGFTTCRFGRPISCNCLPFRTHDPIPPAHPFGRRIWDCVDSCEPHGQKYLDCILNTPINGGIACGECEIYKCMSACIEPYPCEETGNPQGCRDLKQRFKNRENTWCQECADQFSLPIRNARGSEPPPTIRTPPIWSEVAGQPCTGSLDCDHRRGGGGGHSNGGIYGTGVD
jgi:RHS repeat-associated protein